MAFWKVFVKPKTETVWPQYFNSWLAFERYCLWFRGGKLQFEMTFLQCSRWLSFQLHYGSPLDIRYSAKWFVCQPEKEDRNGGHMFGMPSATKYAALLLCFVWLLRWVCCCFLLAVMAVLLANANGFLQGQVDQQNTKKNKKQTRIIWELRRQRLERGTQANCM